MTVVPHGGIGRQLVEIGRDSLRYLAANLLTAVMGLVAVVVLAKIWTTNQFGIYSLISSAVTLASPLLAEWLVASVARFHPEFKRDEGLPGLYSTALLSGGALNAAVAALGVTVVLVFFWNSGNREYALLTVLLLVLTAEARIILAFMWAGRRSFAFATGQVALAASRYVLGIALAYFLDLGVEGVLYGWLIGLVLTIPVSLKVLEAGHLVRARYYSSETLKRMLKFGVPLAVFELTSAILAFADRFMVDAFRGTSETGLYSMIYSLVFQVVAVALLFISVAGWPVIAAEWEAGRSDGARRLVSELTRYFLIVAAPVAVALCVLSSRILEVVTSPQYYEAGKIMLPVVVGILFFRLSWFPGSGMLLRKKTGLYVVAVAACAALNVLLNLFMIPAWGYPGAAIATALSYAAFFAAVTWAGVRQVRWDFPWVSLLRVGAAGAVMGLIFFFMDSIGTGGFWGLLLILAVGTAAYVLMLLATGEITGAERRAAALLTARIIGRRKRDRRG